MPSNTHPASSRETNDFWKGRKVERFEEITIFSLSPAELDKCRYEIINQSQRMAECTVHREGGSHGIKLHPPHLYDLRDDVVYYMDKGRWIRWKPDLKARKEDIKDLTESK